MRQWLGSILFTSYLFLSVPAYGAIALLAGLLRREWAYGVAKSWVASVLWLLRRACGLDFVLEGRANMPDSACVVLLKHSSAWETLAQLQIFPRQTWVLKRELMWVPVFGWVLSLLQPIAIDRKGGGAAVAQVLTQGRARLAEGFYVMIFPEGTRMPVGQTRRYGMSGVLLAGAAGVPIVPVAHNAGYFWPRRGWLKRSGTIRVVVGEPIATEGVDPRELNERVQRWIESTVERLAP